MSPYDATVPRPTGVVTPSGLAIIGLDRQDRVVVWSPGAEELFGFASSQAVGQPIGRLLFSPEMAAHWQVLDLAARSPAGEDHRWRMPLLHADGHQVVADVHLADLDVMAHLPGAAGAALALVCKPPEPDIRVPSPPGALLQRLFAHAPVAITLIDAQGRQQAVSAHGLELLGHRADYDGAVDTRMVVHPDDLPTTVARLRTTDDQGRPVAVRYRVRANDGSWRWLESVSADLTHDPVVRAFVVFSRDVTDDQRRALDLRTAEARLQALISNIQAAAFLADADGAVVTTNDRLRDLPVPAGCMLESALLASLAEAAEDPDTTMADLARLATAGGAEHTGVVLHDGRSFDVECVPVWAQPTDGLTASGSPPGVGTDLGRLWLLRDATQRERDARRQRDLFAQEQAARAAAEAQAAQLRDFDDARTRFVSMTSHELRTPLASVASALEFLVGAEPQERAAYLDEYLALMARNVDRLRTLTEDLLVVGQLDTGMLTLDLARIDVPALVAGVADDLAPLAGERGMHLRVDAHDGPRLLGDPVRLQQVLVNVLANAVKFGEPGTPVDLAAQPVGATWHLTVRDHGPGIPASEREAVFERFHRSASARRAAVPGTGLGLTIARGIAVLHGGTLTAEEAPGGGACLRCILPVDGPQQVQPGRTDSTH